MIKKLIAVLCFVSTTAFAFDKPIQVIIPFPPGGGVDAAYRHFEKYAHNKGIATIPVYKPGADGLIAMRELDTSANDGYTISFTTTAVLANAEQKDPTLQLQPLTAIKNPLGSIVVSSKSDIQTFDQLITKIKSTDRFNIASGAPGQTMVWTQLFEVTNTPVRQFINYKGGQQVLNDLIGGHVDAAMLPTTITNQQAKNGTIRILAHTGSVKLEGFDQSVPLARRFSNWRPLDLYIVVAPKMERGTSDKLNNLLKQYVLDREVQNEFVADYNDVVLFGTGPIVEAIKNIHYINSKISKN